LDVLYYAVFGTWNFAERREEIGATFLLNPSSLPLRVRSEDKE
jgi:hypothetical protein